MKHLFLSVITISVISIMINPFLSCADNQVRTPKYVGSDACKGCHEKEYRSFITYAKKATSFKSIERVRKGLTKEELKVCYYCHTTGYGKPGGFISEKETPHLKNAGCEVCHGPGEFHIKKKDSSYIKKHLTTEDCVACHTSERIKAFRYRPLVHGGAH
jgi:hypothetical protein